MIVVKSSKPPEPVVLLCVCMCLFLTFLVLFCCFVWVFFNHTHKNSFFLFNFLQDYNVKNLVFL